MALPDTFSLFQIVEQAHPNSVLLIFHSKKTQNYKVVNFYKNIELEKIYNCETKQKSDAKLSATPKKIAIEVEGIFIPDTLIKKTWFFCVTIICIIRRA